MLVIFLILFTKVIADSDEDKYVDLLPDAEKQQFIEDVARRILKDVESQEGGKQHSGELSDEELKKHSDYVKSILKQETDYARRNKEELAKDRDEKPGSDEKDGLDVKPLETEKIAAIADDPDLDNVDLTLRNDRRGIGGVDKKSDDYNIKVEIITDDPPIIKRSVHNDTSSDESDSDDFTSETSEKLEPTTVQSNQKETATETPENVISTTHNIKIVNTTTEGQKLEETTTVAFKNIKSKNESTDKVEFVVRAADHVEDNSNKSKEVTSTNKNSELIETKSTNLYDGGGIGLTNKVEFVVRAADHVEDKSNKSKEVTSTNKNSELIETTTIDLYIGGGIGLTAPKNNDSSESDDEIIKVKGIQEVGLRKLNDEIDISKENITKSESTTNGMEYIGAKGTENKSDEYKTASSTDIEEITTLTSPTESTTESVPTSQNINEVTTAYINPLERETQSTPTTEFSTITSTLTDEGTTDLIRKTTYKPSAETLTQAETSTLPSTKFTTENTFKPVATTEEMNIIVEEFTSAPTFRTKTDFTLKVESSTKTAAKKKMPTIKIRALLPSLQISSSDEDMAKIVPHRIEFPIIIPKRVHDNIIGKAVQIPKRKKPTVVKPDAGTDKNFLELQKVYFDNNYKVKMGKEYHVYEIPANKSPFTMDEGMMTDEPYYVPVYNYSPNHAYFNPTNRLGPNPSDIVSKENLGTFTVTGDDGKVKPGTDSSNDNHSEEIIENTEPQNVDMDYSDSAFSNKRKKFGNQQRPHTIHKMPQQSKSKDKKHGHGKVNPEDYLDSDYYFGRIRKDLERRVNHNHNHNDLFPNSNENEHPTHSIQELNLKDHVRAVRNILFQQKFFGLVTAGREGRTSKPGILRQKKKKTSHDNTVMRNGLDKVNNKDTNNKDHDDNIAIDYYFGRAKPSAVLTTDIKNATKTNNHIQKVGYLKGENDTKELYVIDEFFKDNVMKYIHHLNTKDNIYIKSDLMPATPLPIPNIHEDKPIQDLGHDIRFIDKHKQLNGEIIKQLKIVAHKTEATEGLETIIMTADTTNNKTYDNIVDSGNYKTANFPDGNINETRNSTTPELNLRLNRRNDVIKVGVYLDVLKDMISVDSKALKQYDWLGTTVDIQASLQKLFELTGLVVNEEDVHPSDMEILKYVIFLHKLASEIVEANDFGMQLRKKLALPRNKRKKLKPRFLKEKGLINRVWLYLRKETPEVNDNGALRDLNKFLMDLEDGIFDLHEAIKTVAKITKYNNQHWYQNIKELYLNTDEKHLLELLLHVTVSRLFGLIEESAKNGLEDDYVQYMKKNRKEAKKTLEEMLFVMQIIDEINKIVE